VLQWAATDGVVTIKIPDQQIEVHLTDGNQLTTCSIVELKNNNGTIQANREVRYFKDQKYLDEHYGLVSDGHMVLKINRSYI
jgi:tellurite resistance protein TerA